ncbi:putative Dynein heavy chain, N-terminal region 2 [Blattamonas nauphoetae]|uniref:Dynein heavy chain, N-terminal region 2 n=1 Tax=Blattamonas nauphoetae TaxID=2049346 RepID=A0ABQ9XKJ1_9EUKA|nr:putative Dynein heavy chain, N-terminal region 2 [Blattamonas nauphoetae]
MESFVKQSVLDHIDQIQTISTSIEHQLRNMLSIVIADYSRSTHTFRHEIDPFGNPLRKTDGTESDSLLFSMKDDRNLSQEGLDSIRHAASSLLHDYESVLTGALHHLALQSVIYIKETSLTDHTYVIKRDSRYIIAQPDESEDEQFGITPIHVSVVLTKGKLALSPSLREIQDALTRVIRLFFTSLQSVKELSVNLVDSSGHFSETVSLADILNEEDVIKTHMKDFTELLDLEVFKQSLISQAEGFLEDDIQMVRKESLATFHHTEGFSLHQERDRSVWEELNRSGVLLREALISCTAFLTIGDINIPLRNRLFFLNFLLFPQEKYIEDLRQSSWLPAFPRDFPTFYIPSSFSPASDALDNTFVQVLTDTLRSPHNINMYSSHVLDMFLRKDIRLLLEETEEGVEDEETSFAETERNTSRKASEIQSMSSFTSILTHLTKGQQSSHSPSSFTAHNRKRKKILSVRSKLGVRKNMLNRAHIVHLVGFPHYTNVIVEPVLLPQPTSPAATFFPDPIPFQCEICNESFVSLVTATNHINSVHKTLHEKAFIRLTTSLRMTYLARSIDRIHRWIIALDSAYNQLQKEWGSGESSDPSFLTSKELVVSAAPPEQLITLLVEALVPLQMTQSLRLSFTDRIIPLLLSLLQSFKEQQFIGLEQDILHLLSIVNSSLMSTQSELMMHLRTRGGHDETEIISGEHIGSRVAEEVMNQVSNVNSIDRFHQINLIFQHFQDHVNHDAYFAAIRSGLDVFHHFGIHPKENIEPKLRQGVKIFQTLNSFRKSFANWSTDKQHTLSSQLQRRNISLHFEIQLYIANLEELKLEEDIDTSLPMLSINQKTAAVDTVHLHLSEKQQRLAELNQEEILFKQPPTKIQELKPMANRIGYLSRLFRLYQDYLEWVDELRASRLLTAQLDHISMIRLKFVQRLQEVRELAEKTPITSTESHPIEKRMENDLDAIKKPLFICDIDPRHMKRRHWEELATKTGKALLKQCLVDCPNDPTASPTFGELFDSEIELFEPECRKLSISAFNESKIEAELNQLKEQWTTKIKLDFEGHQSNDSDQLAALLNQSTFDGTKLVSQMSGDSLLISENSIKRIITTANNSLTELESLSYNHDIGPFLESFNVFRQNLTDLPQNLLLFQEAQSVWVTLRNLFGSHSVAADLPDEHRMFIHVTGDWARVIVTIRDDPRPYNTFRAGEFISHVLGRLSTQLKQCKERTWTYLHRKADTFPLLYLLPIDEISAALSLANTTHDLLPILHKLYPSFRDFLTEDDQSGPSVYTTAESSGQSQAESIPSSLSSDSDNVLPFRFTSQAETTHSEFSGSSLTVSSSMSHNSRRRKHRRFSLSGWLGPVDREAAPDIPTPPIKQESHDSVKHRNVEAGPVIRPVVRRRMSVSSRLTNTRLRPRSSSPKRDSPSPREYVRPPKSSVVAETPRSNFRIVKIFGIIGKLHEKVTFLKPIVFVPGSDHVVFLTQFEKAIKHAVMHGMIEANIRSFHFFSSAVNTKRTFDGMNENDSEDGSPMQFFDQDLDSDSTDTKSISSNTSDVTSPRPTRNTQLNSKLFSILRNARTESSARLGLSTQTHSEDDVLTSRTIKMLHQSQGGISPDSSQSLLRRPEHEVHRTLQGYVESLLYSSRFKIFSVPTIRDHIVFIDESLDQAIYLACTTHLNYFIQQLNPDSEHYFGARGTKPKMERNNRAYLLQTALRLQNAVTMLLTHHQEYLSQSPSLLRRMKIETTLLAHLNALSFINTYISILRQRNTTVLANLMGTATELPRAFIPNNAVNRRITDSFLSRILPHNSQFSIRAASSHASESELSESRIDHTLETSMTSFTFEQFPAHLLPKIAVQFGDSFIPYQAEYIPFMGQTLQSWGAIDQIRVGSQSAGLVSRVERISKFWSQIARNLSSTLPPSFDSWTTQLVNPQPVQEGDFIQAVGMTFLESESLHTVRDRIVELGYLCGHTIAVLTANESIDMAHTIIPFLHGVIGHGIWGVIENVNILDENINMSIRTIIGAVAEGCQNAQTHIHLVNGVTTIISPGFHLFCTLQLNVHKPSIADTIRQQYRPIVLYKSDDETILFSHLVLSGYKYSSLLSNRIITFFTMYQNVTKQNYSNVSGLIYTMSIYSSAYSLLALDRYLRPLLQTAFKTNGVYSSPLLHWLSAEDDVMTSLKKSLTFTIDDDGIPPIEVNSVDVRVFDHAHKKEKLLFLIECLSMSLCLGEYVRHTFLAGDAVSAVVIFRKLFPEFPWSIVHSIFSFSPNIFLTGVPTSMEEVKKEHSKHLFPEESAFLSSLQKIVTHIATAPITFTHQLASSVHSTQSTLMHNSLHRLMNALQVEYPSTYSRDERFSLAIRVAFENDWAENSVSSRDSESSDDTPSIGFPSESSFGSVVSFSSNAHSAWTKVPHVGSLRPTPSLTNLSRLVAPTDQSHSVFNNPQPGRNEEAKWGPKSNRLGIGNKHDNVNDLQLPSETSLDKTQQEQVTGIVSCVLELHKLLRNPLWTSPVSDGSLPQVDPVAVLGPPGSGKTTIIDLLAVAQTWSGHPTRVVRLNATSMEGSELLGSFGKTDKVAELTETTETIGPQIQTSTDPQHNGLQYVDPPIFSMPVAADNTPAHWREGVLHKIMSDASISRDSKKEEVFLVIDLGAFTRKSPTGLSDTCPDVTRGFYGKKTVSELTPAVNDPGGNWVTQFYSLFHHNNRYQTTLETEYLRRVSLRSSEEQALLERTGIVYNDPYTSTLTNRAEVVDLILHEPNVKHPPLSPSMKVFTKTLWGLYPTRQRLRTISTAKIEELKEKKRKEAIIKKPKHFRRKSTHRSRKMYPMTQRLEAEIQRRTHKLTKHGQFSAHQMSIVDTLTVTLQRRRQALRTLEQSVADTDILQELNESIAQSQSMLMPNMSRLFFGPHIKIIFEAVSIDNFPSDFSANLSVVSIPPSIFASHHRNIFFKEVSVFSSSSHVIFEYIYTELVTQYILNNPFLSENWMKDEVHSNIYKHIMFSAGLLTTWMNEAGHFVRLSFVNNVLVLHKAHLRHLLPMLLTGVLPQTHPDQNTNQKPRPFPKESLLNGNASRVRNPLSGSHQSSLDPVSVIRNIATYSIFWGLGGAAFSQHSFLLEFSKFFTNTLGTGPKTSTLYQESIPQSLIEKDLSKTQQFLGEEARSHETLADYIVDLTTGRWELAHSYGSNQTPEVHPKLHHTSSTPYFSPVTRSGATSSRSPKHSPKQRDGDKDPNNPRNLHSIPFQQEYAVFHTSALFQQERHSVIFALNDISPLKRIPFSLLSTPLSLPIPNDETVTTHICPIFPNITPAILSNVINQITKSNKTASQDLLTSTGPNTSDMDLDTAFNKSRKRTYSQHEPHSVTTSVILQFFPPFSLQTLSFARSLVQDSNYNDNTINKTTKGDGLRIAITAPLTGALWIPPRILRNFALVSFPEPTMFSEQVMLDTILNRLLFQRGKLNMEIPMPRLSTVNIPHYLSTVSVLTNVFSSQELLHMKNLLKLGKNINENGHFVGDVYPPENKAAVRTILTRIPSMTTIIYRLFSFTDVPTDASTLTNKAKLSTVFSELTRIPITFTHCVSVIQKFAAEYRSDTSFEVIAVKTVMLWILTCQQIFFDRVGSRNLLSIGILLSYFGSCLLSGKEVEFATVDNLISSFPLTHSFDLADSINCAMIDDYVEAGKQLSPSQPADTPSVTTRMTVNDFDPFKDLSIVPLEMMSTVIQKKDGCIITPPHFDTTEFLGQLSAMTGFTTHHLRFGESMTEFRKFVQEMIEKVIFSPKPVVTHINLSDLLSLSKVDDVFQARQAFHHSSSESTPGHEHPQTYLYTLIHGLRKGYELHTDFDQHLNSDSPVLLVNPSGEQVDIHRISSVLYTLSESTVPLHYFYTEHELKQLLIEATTSGFRRAINVDWLTARFKKQNRFLFFIEHYEIYKVVSQRVSNIERTLIQSRVLLDPGADETVFTTGTPTKLAGKSEVKVILPGLNSFGWILPTFGFTRIETYSFSGLKRLMRNSFLMASIRNLREIENSAKERLLKNNILNRDRTVRTQENHTLLKLTNNLSSTFTDTSVSAKYLIDENVFPMTHTQSTDRIRVKLLPNVPPRPTPPPLPLSYCAKRFKFVFFPSSLVTRRFVMAMRGSSVPMNQELPRFGHPKTRDFTHKSWKRSNFSTALPKQFERPIIRSPTQSSTQNTIFPLPTDSYHIDSVAVADGEEPTPDINDKSLMKRVQPKKKPLLAQGMAVRRVSFSKRLSNDYRNLTNRARSPLVTVSSPAESKPKHTNLPKKSRKPSLISESQQRKSIVGEERNQIRDQLAPAARSQPLKSVTLETPIITHRPSLTSSQKKRAGFEGLGGSGINVQKGPFLRIPVEKIQLHRKTQTLEKVVSAAMTSFLMSNERHPYALPIFEEIADSEANSAVAGLVGVLTSFLDTVPMDEDSLFLSYLAAMHLVVARNYQYYSYLNAMTSWAFFRNPIVSPSILLLFAQTFSSLVQERMRALELRRSILVGYYRSLLDMMTVTLPAPELLRRVASYRFSKSETQPFSAIIKNVFDIMKEIREQQALLKSLKQTIADQTNHFSTQRDVLASELQQESTVSVAEAQQHVSQLKVRDLAWIKKNSNPPYPIRFLMDMLLIILQKPLNNTEVHFVGRQQSQQSTQKLDRSRPTSPTVQILDEEEKLTRLVRGIPVFDPPPARRGSMKSGMSETGVVLSVQKPKEQRVKVIKYSETHIHRMISNQHFINQIVTYQPNTLTEEQVELLEPYLASPLWNPNYQCQDSPRTDSLFEFLRGLLCHHRIRQTLVPHKVELENQVENILASELPQLRETITNLDNLRIRLIVVLHQIQNQFPLNFAMSKVQKTVLGSDALDLYDRIIRITVNQIEVCEQNIVNCRGDCALAAAFTVYHGAIPQSEWSSVVSKWQRLLWISNVQFAGFAEYSETVSRRPPVSPRNLLVRGKSFRTGSPDCLSLKSQSRELNSGKMICVDISQDGMVHNDDFSEAIVNTHLEQPLRSIWNVLHGPSTFYESQSAGLGFNPIHLFFYPLMQVAPNNQPIVLIDPLGFGEDAILKYLRPQTVVVLTSILDTDFFQHALEATASGYPLLVDYADVGRYTSEPRSKNLLDCLDTLCECTLSAPINSIVLCGKEIAVQSGFRLILIIKRELSLFPSINRNLCSTSVLKHSHVINFNPLSSIPTLHNMLKYSLYAPVLMPQQVLARSSSFGRMRMLIMTTMREEQSMITLPPKHTSQSVHTFFTSLMGLGSNSVSMLETFKEEANSVTQSNLIISRLDHLVDQITAVIIAVQCQNNQQMMHSLGYGDVREVLLGPFKQFGLPNAQQLQQFLHESLRRSIFVVERTKQTEIAKSNIHVAGSHTFNDIRMRKPTSLRLRDTTADSFISINKSAHRSQAQPWNMKQEDRELVKLKELIVKHFIYRIVSQINRTRVLDNGLHQNLVSVLPFLLVVAFQFGNLEKKDYDLQNSDLKKKLKTITINPPMQISTAAPIQVDIYAPISDDLTNAFYAAFARGSPFVNTVVIKEGPLVTSTEVEVSALNVLSSPPQIDLVGFRTSSRVRQHFISELKKMDDLFRDRRKKLGDQPLSVSLVENFLTYESEWSTWVSLSTPEMGPYPPMLFMHLHVLEQTMLISRLFPHRILNAILILISKTININFPIIHKVEDTIALVSDLSYATQPVLIYDSPSSFHVQPYLKDVRIDYILQSKKFTEEPSFQGASGVLSTSLPDVSIIQKTKLASLLSSLHLNYTSLWGPHLRSELTVSAIAEYLGIPKTMSGISVQPTLAPSGPSLELILLKNLPDSSYLFKGHLSTPKSINRPHWTHTHSYINLQQFIKAVFDSLYAVQFSSLPNKFFHLTPTFTQQQLRESVFYQIASKVEDGPEPEMSQSKRRRSIWIGGTLPPLGTVSVKHAERTARPKQQLISLKMTSSMMKKWARRNDIPSIVSSTTRQSTRTLLSIISPHPENGIAIQTAELKPILPVRSIRDNRMVIANVDRHMYPILINPGISTSLIVYQPEMDISLPIRMKRIVSWIPHDYERRAVGNTLLSVLLFVYSNLYAIAQHRLHIQFLIKLPLFETDHVPTKLNPESRVLLPRTSFSQPLFLQLLTRSVEHTKSFTLQNPLLTRQISESHRNEQEMSSLINHPSNKPLLDMLFAQLHLDFLSMCQDALSIPEAEFVFLYSIVPAIFTPSVLLPSYNFWSISTVFNSSSDGESLLLPINIRQSFTRQETMTYLDSRLMVRPPSGIIDTTQSLADIARMAESQQICSSLEHLLPKQSSHEFKVYPTPETLQDSFNRTNWELVCSLPSPFPEQELVGLRKWVLHTVHPLMNNVFVDELYSYNVTLHTLISSIACFSPLVSSASPLHFSASNISSMLFSPMTLWRVEDLPRFFIENCSIPYHVTLQFEHISNWMASRKRLLICLTVKNHPQPTVFPISLLSSPAAFLISFLFNIEQPSLDPENEHGVPSSTSGTLSPSQASREQQTTVGAFTPRRQIQNNLIESPQITTNRSGMRFCEETDHLQISFVKQNPATFTSTSSYHSEDNGENVLYIVGISLHGCAWDYEEGEIIAVSPTNQIPQHSTHFPIVKVTRRKIGNDHVLSQRTSDAGTLSQTSSTLSSPQSDVSRGTVLDRLDEYTNLAAFSPRISPDSVYTSQFFRLFLMDHMEGLSSKDATHGYPHRSSKRNIRNGRHSSQPQSHNPPLLRRQSIIGLGTHTTTGHSVFLFDSPQAPFDSPFESKPPVNRPLHTTTIFSSSTKRTTVIDAIIEHDSFARWEELGCYLFVDFDPAMIHLMGELILPSSA